MSRKIRPIGEYLLVGVLPEKNETPQGLIIPDIHWIHRFRRGVVLDKGGRVPNNVNVGDRVVFAKEHFDHGTEKAVKYLLRGNGEEGEDHHLLKWYDILMVLDAQDDGTYHEVS